MFTKRRPARSSRTANLLYQLGYICSGTAFGLATLCLEEQRRRIQILQRIADNAKIIRQHPRYRGSLALALENGEGLEFDGVEGGWTPERLARKRMRKHDETNEAAAEDPALPSVVNTEGAEVQSRSQDILSAHGAKYRLQQTSPSFHLSSNSKHQFSPGSGSAGRQVLQRPIFAPRESYEDGSPAKSTWAHTVVNPSCANLKKSHDLTSIPRKEFVPASRAKHSDFATVTHVESLQTGKDSSVDAIPLSRNHTDPTSELEHIDTVFSKKDTRLEHLQDRIKVWSDWTGQNPSEAANSLPPIRLNKFFNKAVDVGSLEDIRSISYWRLQHGMFSNTNARYLSRRFRQLGNRVDRQQLSDFSFSTLLSGHVLQHLDYYARLELGFTIIGCFSAWEGDVDLSPLRLARLDDCMRGIEDVSVVELLQKVCKDFTAGGEARAASKLFLLVLGARRLDRQVNELFHLVFKALLSGGHLSDIATLLLWRATHDHSQALTPALESFIQACGERKSYGPLVGVFRQQQWLLRRAMRRLTNVDSLAIVCSAVGTDASLQQFFDRLYRKLPGSTLFAIDEGSFKALRTTWNSTRNLDRVDLQIAQLAERLNERRDEDAICRLDEVAIGIYVSARALDRAVDILARMRRTREPSAIAMCQTALLFAKQGSWESFARLLELMKESKTLTFNRDACRIIQEILRFYSPNHSAEEVWSLLTTMLQDLHVPLNRVMLETVLGSFATKKRFDLVSKMVEFLRASGHTAEMDTRMVTVLLRRYYIERRPNHIFMMMLCRSLIVRSPAFAGKSLVGLIEQAIGYDLRHLHGVGELRPWKENHAKKRLDRLQHSNGFIPSPGFVWNDKLYFHDTATDHLDPEQTVAPAVVPHMPQSSTELDMAEPPIEREEYFPFASSDFEPTLETLDFEPNLNASDLESTLEVPDPQLTLETPEFDLTLGPQDFEPTFNEPDLETTLEAEYLQPVFQAPDFEPIFETPDFEAIVEEAHAESIFELPEVEATIETLRVADEEDAELPRDPGRGEYHFFNLYPKSLNPEILEEQMWLQISLREYERAIELYHANLNASGLPASPVLLEIAVEASIRLHNGHRAEAYEIVSSAQAAGMNPSCAIGPFIIRDLKEYDPNNEIDVKRLKRSVLAYYKSNHENGWRVTHYVGTSAANLFARDGYNSEAVELLSSIHHSSWAQELPLDIAAMTVFLKAYINTQSLSGIQWVIDTVFQKDMLIDNTFIQQLRYVVRGNYRWMDRHSPNQYSLFDYWVQLCRDKQEQQQNESYKFGNELVREIVKCLQDVARDNAAGQAPLVDKGHRYYDASPGDLEFAGFVDESYYSDEGVESAAHSDPNVDIKKQVLDDWVAEQVFLRRTAAAARTWNTVGFTLAKARRLKRSGESDDLDHEAHATESEVEYEEVSFKPIPLDTADEAQCLVREGSESGKEADVRNVDQESHAAENEADVEDGSFKPFT